MDNNLANLLNTVELYLEKDKEVQQKDQNRVYTWREEFSEMVNIIENFGFEIISFSKPIQKGNGYGYLRKGIYQCAYNGWMFNVVHQIDADRSIGTNFLYVYCFANPETLETFEYTVNLTEALSYNYYYRGRSHEFVQLMKLGEQKYLKRRYGHYLELPSLLTKHGYTVTETSNFTFVLDNNKEKPDESLNVGWFVINDLIKISVEQEIKAKSDRQEDFLSIENFKPLDFETENEEHWFSFDYNSKKDLPALLSLLALLKEQYNGHYGYCENGTLYKNKDVESLFSLRELKGRKYSSSEPGMFLDSEEIIGMYDCCEIHDNLANPTIGIDLLKEYQLFLRNQTKESNEYIYQDIYFTLAYNKQVNEKECILTIKHDAFFHKKVAMLAEDHWKFEDEPLSSHTVEFKGSFLTCIKEWKAFLIDILEKEGLTPHSDLLKI